MQLVKFLNLIDVCFWNQPRLRARNQVHEFYRSHIVASSVKHSRVCGREE